MNISRLGQKLGVKLSEKKVPDNSEGYQTLILQLTASIEKHFQ